MICLMRNLSQKKTILVTAILFLLLIGGGMAISGIRLYFNLTDSLPHTVYIKLPSDASCWKKDHYLLFSHPRYPKWYLIKQIKGLPGDAIDIQDEQVKVGQETLTLLKQTKEGTPLQPLKTPVIPDDYVFVVGTNPISFDSRYEEFGLIHRSQIKGRVWPLF